MIEYSSNELHAIYELGRLYYEMGYFAPAERIFQGLKVIDGGTTAAKLALGLIKFENGLLQDAEGYFRSELNDGKYQMQAKIGLAAVFVAQGELNRARSILSAMERELSSVNLKDPDIIALWKALMASCER